MKKTILIAGGSGLIGTFLQKNLIGAGHQVRILSRDRLLARNQDVYHWNPRNNEFDPDSLAGVEVVINLVGANVADGRWTESRKKDLWESRIMPSEFLLRQIRSSGRKIECYVGASATGIYGDRGDEILNEESATGDHHFLVDLALAWEKAHQSFTEVASRVISLRIGVVLSEQGGALPKLKFSTIFGIGGYLSSGRQYMPWIHIEDLTRVFEYIIQDRAFRGPVNAAAPHPVTNFDFIRILSKERWGFAWLIPVPEFLLRWVLGEMADVLLYSQRVIPDKLLKLNFTFKYQQLSDALSHLLHGKG